MRHRRFDRPKEFFDGASMPTSIARGQIDIIDEQWKANHIEAMAFWAFEDFLRFCIEAFDRIGRQDEGWRRLVLRGERSFSADEEKELLELYSLWERTCSKLLEPLSVVEKRGYTIECAARFRACVREAKGILTADEDFFDSDALAELRDRAIDDNRHGEVEHVGGQG